MKDPKNIIVRMPNWIGDVVMATPLLRDLKDRFPKAILTAMCSYPILSKDPSIDKIITSRAQLRDGAYDLGILTTNSFSSAWQFFQGRVENRIGFKNELRSPLLTISLPFPEKRKEQHLVKTYKALLDPLNIPESSTKPQLYVDAEEINSVCEQYNLQKGEPLIGINPTAAFGPAKCWLPERFRELAKRLAEDAKVLFFGSGESVELVKEMCHGLPPNVINLAGATSLRELLAITSLCDLFITNDSGPMHIADAFGIPLVAIFGSTSPIATGPYNTNEVLQKKVSCAPCFKRECPIDFRCMKRITVDDVYNEARRKLECLNPSLTH
jgi:heptosyltransferase II